MAGKTGTCQKDYAKGKDNLNYISTFSGYFPADDPKYSCIVVIHEPDKSVGYYGADVSGPVFKTIAQKIYTDTPLFDEVKSLNVNNEVVKKDYQKYYEMANKYKTIMPNLIGMPAMDAIALLENLGLKVQVQGEGKVKQQSIKAGEKIINKKTIVLQLS